jgi:hypothetical protein
MESATQTMRLCIAETSSSAVFALDFPILAEYDGGAEVLAGEKAATSGRGLCSEESCGYRKAVPK